MQTEEANYGTGNYHRSFSGSTATMGTDTIWMSPDMSNTPKRPCTHIHIKFGLYEISCSKTSGVLCERYVNW